MKTLNKWLRREAARDRRRGSLDEALLTNRAWKYGRYRLRYVVIRAILRAAMHLAEVVLFSSVFSMDFLAPVLIIRSVAAFGVSGWWGGLEQLRTRVREHAQKREWPSVRKTIDAWMFLTVIVAVVVIGGGTTWVLSTPDEYLGFSIFDTFALGCFLRFALDILVKTYHSGMFAVARIYRPLWSLLIGDFLDVACVLALWPFLGPWSFGIVIAAVGIIRAAIAFIFVRRSYYNSKIPQMRFRPLMSSWRRLRLDDFVGFTKHSLANVALGFDSILIIALVGVGSQGGQYLWLAIMFYVIRPFVMAGYSWARLFYFDFKKLDLKYSDFFSDRFEKFLIKLALAFAAVTTALSAAWILAFWRGPLDMGMLVFVPFFFVRSVMGLFQIQAFSYGRYKYLMGMTSALGLAVGSVWFLPQNNVLVLSVVTGIMLVALLVFRTPGRLVPEATGQLGEGVSIYRWLALLGRENGPVRVGLAAVSMRGVIPAGRVLTKLCEDLKGRVTATRLGRSKLLWYERKGSECLNGLDMALLSAGLLDRFQITEWVTGGVQALRSASKSQMLEVQLQNAVEDKSCERWTAKSLEVEFLRRFKDGVVLGRKHGALKLGRGELGAQEISNIAAEIRRVSGGALGSRRSREVDVSVYCPGKVTLVFLLERQRTSPEDRNSWRRFIDNISFVHSTLG